jgi:hypothetical protein
MLLVSACRNSICKYGGFRKILKGKWQRIRIPQVVGNLSGTWIRRFALSKAWP